jgi:hypothetical protein
MANMQLQNDDVMRISLLGKDAAGDVVPLPAGLTPTIVNSDPVSMSAVVNADGSYTLRALVPLASGISIEVDDGSLKPEITLWDIVADVAPVSVASNFAAATHTPQPVPVLAAPGAPVIS